MHVGKGEHLDSQCHEQCVNGAPLHHRNQDYFFLEASGKAQMASANALSLPASLTSRTSFKCFSQPFRPLANLLH